MRRFPGLVALMLALPTMASAQDLGPCTEAIEAQTSGDYGLAIELYTECIGLGTGPQVDLALTYYGRGTAYYHSGAYDLAIADYDRALRIDPHRADALVNRGVAYREKGDYERAIEDYDRAIWLKPGSAEAFYNRGVAQFLKRAYDKAIGDYDEAIRLRPDLAEAFNARGLAYKTTGDFEQAIKDYDAALGLDPGFAYAFRNRAVAHRDTGAHDRAIADYDQVIRLMPDYAPAYGSRGELHFYRGHFAAAARDLAAAVDHDPSNPYRSLWRYLAEARAGQEARATLEGHAAALDLGAWPGPVVSLYLGRAEPDRLLALAGDPDPVKRREKACEAYFYLGQYFLLKGRRDEAAKMFRLALDTGVTAFIEYAGAKAELERLGG